MYSKSKVIATGLIALLFSGCAGMLPWHDAPEATEVNVAFTIENNLLFLTTTRVENRKGRFFFSTAAAHSAIDPAFAATIGRKRAYSLDLGQKDAIRFRPVLLDLGGTGDVLLGADAWGNASISIDYRVGLVTYDKAGIQPEGMEVFSYQAEPTVMIDVDGTKIPAIVDTGVPDTIILPRSKPGRGTAHVALAGTDFGTIDVGYANIPRARVGNRVLSRFLVTIDYGRRMVGLWRDPRIATR